MSPKNNNSNTLPRPLQDLDLKEIFLFTGIHLYLLEGFTTGKFKPSQEDREKLTKASFPFYGFNDVEKRHFVDRKKYRTVRGFLSLTEKEDLFFQSGERYTQKLNDLIKKYWEEIVLNTVEK